MTELVFVKSAKLDEQPYTTSEVISEYAGIEHHSVTRLIRDYENDLNMFGLIGFEIHKLNGRGRPKKVYKLNEQQATLLITYLDNTEPVRKFKQQKEGINMFEKKLKLERKDIQEKADNNAKILMALIDCQTTKVFNREGDEVILPIEKLELVIESLNDLKAQIERYDTIENFIYE